MVDDQQAQQNPAGQQDAPMPSADQGPSTSQPASEDAPQEVSSSHQGSEGLPEDASERTRKNFEKVQQQLREERSKREYFEQVFNAMRQPPQQTPAPLYDPNTGLVNENVLTDVQRRALEAEARATRAEAAVQGYLRNQEEQEAFMAHPDLKPESKDFNKSLHNLTRSILTDAMLNPQDYGGKQLSFKQAADLAKSVTKSALENAQHEGAQRALEQLTPKEQAALEATGTPSRRSEVNSNLSDLKRGTRTGNIDATVERLKGVPWK